MGKFSSWQPCVDFYVIVVMVLTASRNNTLPLKKRIEVIEKKIQDESNF